jgi:hypothetical protein
MQARFSRPHVTRRFGSANFGSACRAVKCAGRVATYAAATAVLFNAQTVRRDEIVAYRSTSEWVAHQHGRPSIYIGRSRSFG